MRDLGPFKAKSGHQSTLTEGDSIDILSQRRAVYVGGRPLVHDDDAWSRADGPAAAVLEVLEGGVGHEVPGRAAYPSPQVVAVLLAERSDY